MPDIHRIKKEILDCQTDTEARCQLNLVNDSLRHFKARISGPTNTPYEGGIFQLDILIPDSYPFEPPKVQFDTNIYHPNISSQTGVICLDILKDMWTPALTIKTAILSIQALLCSPEPNDPQDALVAQQLLNNPEEFTQTAKFWTEVYASPESLPELSTEDPLIQQAVNRLCNMGFPESQVRQALSQCDMNEEDALEKLLN
ncbi:Ubiquitin-conjugating enzyme E2 1 [Basidiobolus ranarum]|uniref:Ubiquitin-conjugating enzyme E2 1 n=1 Tax=Basidiobolus ranarum TaxID=34480 RepID=A0ABR2WAR2_9FUNG